MNVCLKCYYACAKKKDGTYYKSSSTKSTDRFLRSPPHNKPFSIISDPAFTEANKVLDAFVKVLRKTGKNEIAGVIHKRAISKEQLNKLFESGELGPADSLNLPSYSKRLGSTLASFLEDGDLKTSDS